VTAIFAKKKGETVVSDGKFVFFSPTETVLSHNFLIKFQKLQTLFKIHFSTFETMIRSEIDFVALQGLNT